MKRQRELCAWPRALSVLSTSPSHPVLPSRLCGSQKVLRAGQKLTQAGEGTGASHSLPRGCFGEALGAPWAAEAKHGDGSGSGSAAAREKWEPEPSEREKEAAQALEPPPHTQWGREDEGEEAAA